MHIFKNIYIFSINILLLFLFLHKTSFWWINDCFIGKKAPLKLRDDPCWSSCRLRPSSPATMVLSVFLSHLRASPPVRLVHTHTHTHFHRPAGRPLCQPDDGDATRRPASHSHESNAWLCSLPSQHAPWLPGCCPTNNSCYYSSGLELPLHEGTHTHTHTCLWAHHKESRAHSSPARWIWRRNKLIRKRKRH